MANEKEIKPASKKALKRAIVEWVAIFLVIGIVVWALFFYEGPWPWEAPAVPTPPIPADVELYRFSDLKTNSTVNVEVWIKNTGGETARDISVFVRCRNQNGTILYMDELDLTWELLGSNETCSATYSVNYNTGDSYVESTLEIRHSTGMHSYLKKTEL